MRRTAPALALLVVGLAVAGCSDDDDASDDAGPPNGASSEFCDDAEDAAAVSDAVTAADQLQALRAFAANAPNEIADDFDVVIDAFVASVDAQASLDTPEVQAARAEIERYVADWCDVELSPTTAG